MKRIKINKRYKITGCIGCNVCVNLAPDCFYVKENGLVGINEKSNQKKIKNCVLKCPVSAIQLQEDNN